MRRTVLGVLVGVGATVAGVPTAHADQLRCAAQPTQFTFGFQEPRANMRVTLKNCVVSWGRKAKAYTDVKWEPAPGIAPSDALPAMRRIRLFVETGLERGAGPAVMDFGEPFKQLLDHASIYDGRCHIAVGDASGSKACSTVNSPGDVIKTFDAGTAVSGDAFLFHFYGTVSSINGSPPPAPEEKPVFVGSPTMRGVSLQTAGSPVIRLP